MITLVIPAGRSRDVVSQLLTKEAATSSNIKSSSTRKAVGRALRKIELPRRIPPNGLVVFAADDHFSAIEPEVPTKLSAYRCEKRYLTELVPRKRRVSADHWWVHLTGDVATLGNTAKVVAKLDRPGGRLKTHNKGGQSAPRFQRHFINADKAWVREVSEWAGKHLPVDVLGVFVGGPGTPTGVVPGASYHAATADSHAFARTVRDVLVPSVQRNAAREVEAACWDKLQTDPDSVTVGRADCLLAIEHGLVKELVIDHTDAVPDTMDQTAITILPPHSLPRFEGWFAHLHYPVDLTALTE